MFYWVLKTVVLGPILKLLFRPWVEGEENIPDDERSEAQAAADRDDVAHEDSRDGSLDESVSDEVPPGARAAS